MNEVESLSAQLAKQGWFVLLQRGLDGWRCSIECGIDKLPESMPRPSAAGPTQLIALRVAITKIPDKYRPKVAA